MMTITKRSALSGTMQTMDVNISGAALIDYGNNVPLAEIAPHLTAVERRFLETGITPEEDAALATLD